MATLRKAQSTYGPRWIVEGYKGLARCYVHRTNMKTYVVSMDSILSFDSMVEIDGEYHFSTLKQLRLALRA